MKNSIKKLLTLIALIVVAFIFLAVYRARNTFYPQSVTETPPANLAKNLEIPSTSPVKAPLYFKEDDDTFNNSPKQIEEKVIYVNNGGLYSYSNTATTTLVSYDSKENIFDLQLSPKKEYLSLEHWNEKTDGCLPPWCWAKTTHISILKKINNTYKPFIEISYPNKVLEDVSWSSNEEFVTYLVESNSGDSSIEARRISDNSVIFVYNSTSITPAEWLSPAKFSYIANGKIFVYDISANLVQNYPVNAKSYQPAFESPSIPLTPHWSKDGRYVFYYTEAAPEIFDTQNKTSKIVGESKIVEGEAGAVRVFEPYPFRRWISNTDVLVGSTIINVNTLATSSFNKYSYISTNRDYRVNYKKILDTPDNYNIYRYVFLNEMDQEICKNLAVGPVYFTYDMEVIDPHHFVVQRLNEPGNITERASYIIDITRCEYVSQTPASSFKTQSALLYI
jgi:hypothetical protein